MFKTEKMKEINAKIQQINKEVRELDNMIMTEFMIPWSINGETDFSYPRMAVVMNLLAMFEIKDSLNVIEALFGYSEEEMKECLETRMEDPEEIYHKFLVLLHEKSLEGVCNVSGLPYDLLSMLPPSLVMEILKSANPEATQEIEKILGMEL